MRGNNYVHDYVSICVCRAPPTLAVSVRASYPHRLGDGSNLGARAVWQLASSTIL